MSGCRSESHGSNVERSRNKSRKRNESREKFFMKSFPRETRGKEIEKSDLKKNEKHKKK